MLGLLLVFDSILFCLFVNNLILFCLFVNSLILFCSFVDAGQKEGLQGFGLLCSAVEQIMRLNVDILRWLKLMSALFYQIFIFHLMIPLQRLWKMFLFHLKSYFCSQDVQIFVFLSFPLFLPVSYCFRGWSKINLKVYDIINFLNQKIITHFVWYLEKDKRCDIETLSIDRILNKEHFYGKIMQKMCTKS